MTGKPTMTVNGKNVPVGLAELEYNNRGVAIASKTDDVLFEVLVIFRSEPQSNTTINSSDSYTEVWFCYAGEDFHSLSPDLDSDPLTYYYGFVRFDTYEYSVEIGEYVPNEYIEIKISGKANAYDFYESEEVVKTYDFEAGGKLNYTDNLSSKAEWFKSNAVPIPE